MEKNKEDLIVKLKVAIIYGKEDVDGVCKDGNVERIYKYEDDTAHFFYMKEFLKTHFNDKEEVRLALEQKKDINSIFFEIQKLGHIVFAESTTVPMHKMGTFYIPNSISDKQKNSLKIFQKQLEKENYNLMELFNLCRKEEGVILGNQKFGKAEMLNELIEEDELEL